VLRSVKEAFNEDSLVAKSRFGFGCRSLEGVFEVFLLPHNTHTSAATTECSLDDDWEAIFVGEFFRSLKLLDWSRCAWYSGDVRLVCKLAGRDLVAWANSYQ
jgi:hypothetical protein